MDVPASVLGQLGLKIQHSLRAFTAADRQVIKQTAQNYPETTFYKTDDLITQLGIGEALITLLNEKGIPTPLAHTMMCTPRSRMDVLTENDIDNIVSHSKLAAKYNQVIDSQSACEMLTAKLEEAAAKPVAQTEKTAKPEESTLEKVVNNTVVKSIMRTAGNTIVRSLLGSLGLGGRTRKSTKSWF
jgi:uncharacterized protein